MYTSICSQISAGISSNAQRDLLSRWNNPVVLKASRTEIKNFVLYIYPTYIYAYGNAELGWGIEWSPLKNWWHICMLAAAVLYHVTVSRCLTLMGKPLGKSTKGKAKAWSVSTSSQWKLRTKWWMNTAISSFANSDPAQSRGPPPNGMK